MSLRHYCLTTASSTVEACWKCVNGGRARGSFRNTSWYVSSWCHVGLECTPGSSINTTRLSAHPSGKRHFRRSQRRPHDLHPIRSAPPRPAGNGRASGRSISYDDLLASKARLLPPVLQTGSISDTHAHLHRTEWHRYRHSRHGVCPSRCETAGIRSLTGRRKFGIPRVPAGFMLPSAPSTDGLGAVSSPPRTRAFEATNAERADKVVFWERYLIAVLLEGQGKSPPWSPFSS